MSSPQSSSIQEYSIRVPKNVKKRYHVMRFNATLGVDFSKWSSVKMERENNMKEFRGIDEETPKFGAGSEFGKEAREEARRKKLGIMTRKYKPDDQPWILKAGGSIGKKFKGIREGGVSENAAYYVFTHAPDGAIEAFPLNEWYKFQPIQRYKSLSAEEAEQEFGKRNRVLNYFSLMLRKRLKGDEEIDAEGEEQEKGKKGPGAAKKTKDLKISDMDEWMDSSEEDSEESGAEEKNEEEKAEKKKKNKKADTKKKKPKRDTDLEAFEDSDDGDNEGRELDYISDSSESEPEEPSKNLQGVAEEKALRKLLTSDEDSEDEENKSEKEQSNEDENDEEKKENKEEKEGDKKKKKKKKKELKKKEASSSKKNKKGEKEKTSKGKETSSDFSSDSTDSESENKKDKNKKDKEEEKEKEKEKEKESNSTNSSRSASPMQGTSQNNKRKLPTIPETASKKPKYDTSLSNYIPGSSESGITEDAVRRYLMRKPMTTTELLQKFKSKKTGLSSEQLVNIMTQILKKINPVKQTIKGKMYLSIKA